MRPISEHERCCVVIITEVRLYREGLVRLLSVVPDFEVFGASSPAGDLPSLRKEIRRRVLIADSTTVRDPSLMGRITREIPDAKVVAFAISEEDEEEIIACAEAGVAGFVARDASTEELIAVIRSAAAGGARCSPRVAAVVLRKVARSSALRSSRRTESHLTRRETEVLALIDAGLSNKKIARKLGVETATIKNHVHNILRKLNVERRGEAAAVVRLHKWPPSSGSSYRTTVA